MANDDGSAARAFHEATKHSFESVHREPHFLDWDNLPSPYKVYKGLPVEPLQYCWNGDGQPAGGLLHWGPTQPT